MNAASGEQPAGFWQRTAGWSLDAALLAPLALALSWPWIQAPLLALQARSDALLRATGTAMADVLLHAGGGGAGGLLMPAVALMHDPALRQASAAVETALWAVSWPPLLAFVLLGAAWQAGFERSRWQASPGRRLLGLRVVDRDGRPIGTAHALGRHAAGGLSWLTLNLGHLMAASAPRRLALHDYVSRTRVHSAQRRLPGWAVAWLAMLAVAMLAANVWLVRYASAGLRAALEAALYY